ncbi:MAG: zf-TFIIB domain-containing protein [Saprospiraceae bacterium]
MKCPKCDVALIMTDRQNIEIDYCPQCRGVWLDRGELDKIIERSAFERGSRKKHDYDDYDDFRAFQPRDSGKYPDSDSYKRHKKKSLLGELFDF